LQDFPFELESASCEGYQDVGHLGASENLFGGLHGPEGSVVIFGFEIQTKSPDSWRKLTPQLEAGKPVSFNAVGNT
jgi:hypothetical protein